MTLQIRFCSLWDGIDTCQACMLNCSSSPCCKLLLLQVDASQVAYSPSVGLGDVLRPRPGCGLLARQVHQPVSGRRQQMPCTRSSCPRGSCSTGAQHPCPSRPPEGPHHRAASTTAASRLVTCPLFAVLAAPSAWATHRRTCARPCSFSTAVRQSSHHAAGARPSLQGEQLQSVSSKLHHLWLMHSLRM